MTFQFRPFQLCYPILHAKLDKYKRALVFESEPLAALRHAISEVVAGTAAALTETDRFKSQSERDGQNRAGVNLRVNLTRLETVVQLFTAWAMNDKVPSATWLAYADASIPDVWLCASPNGLTLITLNA